MNELNISPNTETDTTALSAGKLPPFLQLAQVRRHLKIPIALPAAPWRQFGLADRKMLAARRALELALWQASGGDYLRSSLAARFIHLAKGLGLNAQP